MVAPEDHDHYHHHLQAYLLLFLYATGLSPEVVDLEHELLNVTPIFQQQEPEHENGRATTQQQVSESWKVCVHGVGSGKRNRSDYSCADRHWARYIIIVGFVYIPFLLTYNYPVEEL